GVRPILRARRCGRAAVRERRRTGDRRIVRGERSLPACARGRARRRRGRVARHSPAPPLGSRAVEPRGEGSRRSENAGAIVAVLGGAIGVIGTLFKLASVEYALDANHQISVSKNYIDTDNGKVVAAVAVVVMVIAVVMLVWRISNGLTLILLTGGGLAIFGFALYDRFDLGSKSGSLSFGPALYVVMIGGIVAAVGGVLASRVSYR